MGRTRQSVLQFIRSRKNGRLKCYGMGDAMTAIKSGMNLGTDAERGLMQVLNEMMNDFSLVYVDGYLRATTKEERKKLARAAKQQARQEQNDHSPAPVRQHHRPVTSVTA